MHSLCREQFYLSRTNGEGWGRNFRLCPLLGHQGILTGPNWHNAQLDHVFYKIRPLLGLSGTIYYKGFFIFFFTKSPCGAPAGPDWTKIAHAQLDHGTNNMRPYRSLQYLVTEEIEEQDNVYGQTAGRRTKGYRISWTGL